MTNQQTDEGILGEGYLQCRMFQNIENEAVENPTLTELCANRSIVTLPGPLENAEKKWNLEVNDFTEDFDANKTVSLVMSKLEKSCK